MADRDEGVISQSDVQAIVDAAVSSERLAANAQLNSVLAGVVEVLRGRAAEAGARFREQQQIALLRKEIKKLKETPKSEEPVDPDAAILRAQLGAALKEIQDSRDKIAELAAQVAKRRSPQAKARK